MKCSVMVVLDLLS